MTIKIFTYPTLVVPIDISFINLPFEPWDLHYRMLRHRGHCSCNTHFADFRPNIAFSYLVRILCKFSVPHCIKFGAPFI